MELEDCMTQVRKLTRSPAEGKGLWWDGCTGLKQENYINPDVNSITLRLARKPGMEFEGSIAAADQRSLKTYQQWNPDLTRQDVSSALDSAVQNILHDELGHAEKVRAGTGKSPRATGGRVH